jgi:branched-chain amino acid transport system substrate-binding protein
MQVSRIVSFGKKDNTFHTTDNPGEPVMTRVPTRLRRALTLLLCGSIGCVASVHAQLLIGQTSGFTGNAAAGVKENSVGAQLYFDAVNAKGGVNGQKIELITVDDKFEVPLARDNAEDLIVNKKVLAIFMNRGTPHSEAILPLLPKYQVPLVAPSTGAMVLHKPVNPYVFNVRTSYQREAERAVQHLSLIGLSRIAVLYTDDSFGRDGAVGAAKGFSGVNKQPVVTGKFDRAKPDFSELVPQVTKAEAQAVIIIGSSQAAADGMKALRAAGSKAQLVTLSNNASEGFVKLLGENSRGVIITQVFPYERSVATPMVKEAIELAKAKGLSGVSPAMMEGFAGAKVLVEGLRRAGPNPTRASLIAALNGMRKYDLGGMEVSYSPDDHTGLDFVDLSIVDSNGRLLR